MTPQPIHLLLLANNANEANPIVQVLQQPHPAWAVNVQVLTEWSAWEQALLHNHPQLVLAFLPMATEALQRVQTLPSPPPLVVLTTAAAESTAIELMLAGASDYLLTHQLQRLVPVVLRETNQYLAKHQQHKNEEKYKAIIEQASDGILIFSFDGTILDFNKSAYTFMGYSREEFAQLHLTDLFFLTDLQANPIQFQRLQQGLSTIDDRQLKHKNGTAIEFEISTKTLPDGRLMSIARNVTERKKAEKALKDSEQLFASVFHKSPIAIAIVSLVDGHFYDVNEVFLKESGWHKHEVIGKTSEDLNLYLHIEDRNHVIQQSVQNGYINGFEYQFVTKQGLQQTCLISAIKIEIANKPYLLSSIINITEQKTARLALMQSEDNLNRAQQLAKIGSWELDLMTNNLVWSREHYRIFDIPFTIPSNQLYLAFYSCIHPEDIPHVNEVVSKQQDYAITFRIVTSTGTKYIYSIAQMIRNSEGQVIGMRGTAHDITESTLANQKLVASENQLRGFFNSTTDYIVLADTQMKVLAYNQRYKQIAEYLQHEKITVGGHLQSLIIPNLMPNFVEKFQQALQGIETTIEAQLPLLGKMEWWIVSLIPITSKEQQIIGVAVSHTNIDARKRAEAELTLSEKKLSAYFNSTSEEICLLYPDYTIYAFNKVFQHTNELLHQQKVTVGNNFLSFPIPDNLVAAFKRDFAQAMTGEKVVVEKEVAYTDGTSKWWQTTYVPIFNNEQTVSSIAFIKTDITARKQAEMALMASEQKFRSLVHNISDIITLIDANGAILYQSSSVKQIMGYDEDELKGQSVFTIVHPDDISHIQQHIQQLVLQGGNSPIIECRLLDKSGQYITLEAQGNNQLNNPLIKAIVINSRDISDRKRREQELRNSFQLVSEQNKRLLNFSYIVSHNLRSHTSNIISIGRLFNSLDSEQEKQEMINYLNTTAAALDDTLHNLNDMIAIQSNVNIGFGHLCLVEYVNNTLTVLKQQLHEKQVQLQIAISEQLLVQANPAYLESILINFLSNAIKYSSPQRIPTIHIAAHEESEYCVLTITDNGMGIDLQRYGDKLFGMYKTFHGNKDARGIGLFISKSQIEAMGGRVAVCSQPNKGTTFTIYLKRGEA